MDDTGRELQKVYSGIDRAMVRMEMALAKLTLQRHAPNALMPGAAESATNDLRHAIEALNQAQEDRLPF